MLSCYFFPFSDCRKKGGWLLRSAEPWKWWKFLLSTTQRFPRKIHPKVCRSILFLYRPRRIRLATSTILETNNYFRHMLRALGNIMSCRFFPTCFASLSPFNRSFSWHLERWILGPDAPRQTPWVRCSVSVILQLPSRSRFTHELPTSHTTCHVVPCRAMPCLQLLVFVALHLLQSLVGFLNRLLQALQLRLAGWQSNHDVMGFAKN